MYCAAFWNSLSLCYCLKDFQSFPFFLFGWYLISILFLIPVQVHGNVLNLPVSSICGYCYIQMCLFSHRLHHSHQCDLQLPTLCGHIIPAGHTQLWLQYHGYIPSTDHLEVQVLLQRPDPSCSKPQQCWQCHRSVQPKLQPQHRVCRQCQDRSHSGFETNGGHTCERLPGPSDQHHQ